MCARSDQTSRLHARRTLPEVTVPGSAPVRHHTIVWLVWAVSAVAALQLASSPFTVLLVIGVSTLLVETCAEHRGLAKAFPILVGAAAAFSLLRVALTALTTHGGPDVLVRLPSFRLPVLLGGFSVGGTIERAVVMRSIAEGLVVVGVIATLAAFNAVVSHHELLRLLPRAFHELGLVISVALAFVPSTLAAVTAVREADRARTGSSAVHKRRVLRTVGPVLETGLERALLLAESMESRGFARRAPGRVERRAGALSITGLLLLSGAFAGLLARRPSLAAALAATGGCALTIAVIMVSRAARGGRLRTTPMSGRDRAMVAVTVAAPLLLAWLATAGAPLRWDVHASAFPPLSAAAAPVILLLAAPAVPMLLRREGRV